VSSSALPERISPPDFEAIEAAVMETERGRWFLAELLRRRRAEDTALIMAAIDRLDARATEAHTAEANARLVVDRVAGVLNDIASLLRDLRPVGEGSSLPNSPGRSARGVNGELEARLAALAGLDALDVEKKLELFS
jgi:hypothetical protein